MRTCQRNNCADIKVTEEGGDAPGIGVEIPLQPMEKTTVKQISTLQLMKDLMPEQLDMQQQGGSCDLMENICWSTPLAGLWIQEPTLEQVFWQDL